MPTSDTSFGEFSKGQDVVSAFTDSVTGKVILITGANPGGIGGSTAISLAHASPKILIVAGRSPAKLTATISNIKKVNPDVLCKPLSLDLSSQASCKTAAQEILDDKEIDRIDLLINNAGVMDIPERTLSPEGIEMQFATNHIGHFLFTNLVLPKLTAAAKQSSPGSTRIINLSSRAVVYGPVRFSDYNFTKTEAEIPEAEHMSKQIRQMWDELEDKPYVPQSAYGQSKSANVLFTVGLNERLFEKTGILAIAVHPGGIATELSRHVGEEKLNSALEKFKSAIPGFRLKNLEEGCSTTLVAALDPKLTTKDNFLADCQVADWAPEWSTDPEKAEKLWSLSESLVGRHFTY